MCSIMTEKDTLIESWSPFRHDAFPFIPVWAYATPRNLPYSPITQLMGPQEALNHRMSRSLYEASANQLMMEEDAFNPEVMDVEELRRAGRPARHGHLRPGRTGGQEVQDRDNKGTAQFMRRNWASTMQTIRQMSGVTGENRGLDTNSQSGKAVLAKQEQGGLVTMELFDNLLFARQMEGRWC